MQNLFYLRVDSLIFLTISYLNKLEHNCLYEHLVYLTLYILFEQIDSQIY